MIDDVLSIVCQSDGISGIVVVTDDRDVQAQAIRYQARILPEPKQVDASKRKPDVTSKGIGRLNQIFLMAMSLLAEEGEASVLLLPADVPLINVDNLQQMFSQHTMPGVTLVPAMSDEGTNAMMVSPPQLITPGFGHLSSQRHGDFCRAKGIEPTVLCIPELGLDVDTVDDLRALMAAPIRCSTQRFLLDSDFILRIENLDQKSLNMKGRQTA
jgi:2-phospho-L-lactate guanylyltransferase